MNDETTTLDQADEDILTRTADRLTARVGERRTPPDDR
jgi:hypothetical protein